MSNVLELAPELTSLPRCVQQKLLLARAALQMYRGKVIREVTEEEQSEFIWGDCEPVEINLRTGRVALVRYQYLFQVGPKEVFVEILRGFDSRDRASRDVLVGIVLHSDGVEHQVLSNLEFADCLLCAAQMKL